MVLRNRKSGAVVGLEIKKLIQKSDGKDPRGLTIDYNSCLPCGQCMIKVGSETQIAPCYFLFALLSPDSSRIVTLILMDGDFLNYDFQLHKDAKYSNFTEYNHGPYGEGSVRHRKMYTYPNPLNSSLGVFFEKMLLIVKSNSITNTNITKKVTQKIIRKDKYENEFLYSIVDITSSKELSADNSIEVLKGIFDLCKTRKSKERVAYIPEIPSL